jgi:glycosyltransferase involved in cell wall biosynthesis
VLFTVFTPVYNRRHTLHRVFDSLGAQTLRDFEWVVVDDGSTDGVAGALTAYRTRASFPVRVATQPHQGKHVAWNRALELARGELFVPADSDDAFVPETLERFRELWLSIPAGERKRFSGVNVLCQDPGTGRTVGTAFPRSPMVSDNLELAYVHRVTGEKWGCVRTSVLRETLFPSSEAFRGSHVPESYVWFSLARRYRVLCANERLRLYHRDAADSLMASRLSGPLAARLRRHLPSRYFFKSWHLATNLDYLRRDRKDLVRTLVDVWVSGLLLRGSVAEVLRDQRGRSSIPLLLAALPAGLAVYGYCRCAEALEIPMPAVS